MLLEKGENLSTLIHAENWDKVLLRINSHPNEVHILNDTEELPIHSACLKRDVPVTIIHSLIEAYPQSLQHKSKKFNRTPLHNSIIIKHSSHKKIIKILHESYTKAASFIDSLGHTLLHSYLIYCFVPSLDVVKFLLHAHPNSVKTKDKIQLYPLHCASYTGSWEISYHLIELYPQALLEKSKHEKTPRDLAKIFLHDELEDKLLKEENKIYERKKYPLE